MDEKKNSYSKSSVMYKHPIPRTLHQIWFKNVTTKVVAEPWEIQNTCFKANCVNSPGGWIYRHWDEDNIQELKMWPMIRQFWKNREVYGDARKMSDILRLAILWELGGAYTDSDVGCFKPFDSLLESPSLQGATLLGAQEVSGYFANGIIFAIPKQPFIKWLLDALSARDLTGTAWRVTGPLFWGQEFEKYDQAYPDQARQIKILPPSTFCPLPVIGTFEADFDIAPVWTINFYPFTNPDVFMKNFKEAQERGGLYPHCQALQTMHIIETLTEDARKIIERQQPTEEIFVPIQHIRKTAINDFD